MANLVNKLNPLRKSSLTVFVAMSGGVDSSVAAALLTKQGYEVVGVFMKNWSANSERNLSDRSGEIDGVSYCSTEQDYADMRSVCQHLKIPYYTFNFEKEYKKTVLDHFFAEYRAGRTPNPDVLCNKEIKFGLFFERALKLGADFVATGHHIRKRVSGLAGEQVSKKKITSPNQLTSLPAYQLLKGKDPIKDQTYFVYNLNQKQLQRCLFPIGEYTKSQIRKLAKEMKLPTAHKPDSQGICFIGPVDVKQFLKTVIKQKNGQIVNTSGQVLGEHEGAWFYTIGQRRIEGLSGQKIPLYVIKTDIKKNLVVVGPDEETYAQGVVLEDLHLIDSLTCSPANLLTRSLAAKPRYGPDVYPGKLDKTSKKPVLSQAEGWSFVFDKPQRALTPGQSLVVYDKEICLGGGVIKRITNEECQMKNETNNILLPEPVEGSP